MKRLLSLVAMLLVAFAVCQGQVNSQPGYVVTLQGDTLRGTIDFRSDTRNATVCSFRKDGETQFTDYHPEDISIYRIGDDGVFYVSYVVPVQGKDQRLFVQYLLKGGRQPLLPEALWHKLLLRGRRGRQDGGDMRLRTVGL